MPSPLSISSEVDTIAKVVKKWRPPRMSVSEREYRGDGHLYLSF